MTTTAFDTATIWRSLRCRAAAANATGSAAGANIAAMTTTAFDTATIWRSRRCRAGAAANTITAAGIERWRDGETTRWSDKEKERQRDREIEQLHTNLRRWRRRRPAGW